MDFGQFDSRKASETPRALHLKHPGTGKLLYDDEKPCHVLVLGIEGATGQNAILASQRARMDEKKESDPQTLSKIHEQSVREIAPLIVGFEHVNRGAKPANAPDDVEWFLNLQVVTGSRGQATFLEQVRAFASDRAAILGEGNAS
ncbi:hypothetical protein [Shinella sp.]|uniref:hypothetical protein n=1 Tax=Shinella sp. TaxID=1870904 RepID=UPI004036A153